MNEPEPNAETPEQALHSLVRALREQQKGLTAERRHELWGEIQEGYCEHCGSEHLPCYCHPCFDE